MIELEVVGIPAPKGSKSAVLIAGKPRVIEGKSAAGRAAVKEWGRNVADVGRAYAAATPGFTPLDGPLAVEITFWLPRPKSRPARRYPHPTTRPDLDKLQRTTKDALSKIIWTDDARIVIVLARKRYADTCLPGALIQIREVTWA